MLVNNGLGSIGVSGTGAALALYYTGETLADQAAATQAYALANVKLHRFQGDVFVWMDPFENPDNHALGGGHDDGGYFNNAPGPTACLLTYVWLKLKDVANANINNGVAAASNYDPRPDQDLKFLLRRKDIMRWGTVLVHRIEPMMMAYLGDVTQGGALHGFQQGNPGSYLHDRVAKIPFPKIPRGGLNLVKGEALCCFVACWPAMSANTASSPFTDRANVGGGTVLSPVNVTVYDVSRMLCSL